MFTASLTIQDLDLPSPEAAARHLIECAAGTARPLFVAVGDQSTGHTTGVAIEDWPAAAGPLSGVESFIAGFEDDELQEGIPELLATVRKAAELLHRSFDAWDDEEDSVKEEHAELIRDLKVFMEGEADG